MTQPALKTHTTELHPENGMLDGEKHKVAEVIRTALADTFHLMVETQGVHWNVQGPLFYSIHKLTEQQYQEMFLAIDQLAERIRALGYPAPNSVQELSSGTSAALSSHLSSHLPSHLPSQNDDTAHDELANADLATRIEKLIHSNETISKNLRQVALDIEGLHDVKTSDIFSHRIGVHEENAWMLRSIVS